MKRGKPAVLGAALVAAAAACATTPGSTDGPLPQGPRPTLVVLLTVDQMRPDYVTRFAPELTGGLGRLYRDGAVFTDAHHDHGITETAPGHATLLSGRFPRSTGITRNAAGVRDLAFPLLDAADSGASPARFRGSSLVDWMLAAEPATKILSVSAKDRSAILPVGRSRQEVYWYANNGRFTTSTWYRERLPDWVVAFNARRLPHRWAGQEWRTLPGVWYPELDTVPSERPGRRSYFPHPFSSDTAIATTQFRRTPMMDEVTLQFALHGVRTLQLGAGSRVDLLAVSLSATDYVGHDFGPESREQHDNVLRLDRALGWFFDSLATIRDPARTVVVLSSDHGVALVPELHGRRRISMAPVEAAVGGMVERRGGRRTAVDFESGAFFVDPGQLGPGGMTVREVADSLLAVARRVPGIMRADLFDDLAGMDTSRDALARRWLHMFPEDQRPAVVVTTEPGDTYPGDAGKHGTPHDYDSRVPLVFVGPPFAPGRHDRFVRTVDLAPTLARAIGVRPGERLDGRVLEDAFRR